MKSRLIGLAIVLSCTSASVSTNLTAALPAEWQSRDVGAVGQLGSASESGGIFTVSGAGADIWSTSDAFHFTYRSLSGDGAIVAEVVSILGAQAWTKVGVMMRATTQATSAHASMLVSTGKGMAFQRRTVAGGLSSHTSGGSGTAPRWVKLARAGSIITASVSADGRTWNVVGRDTFSLASTILVGLAVSSHDTTRLATGTFDHVAITATVATKPWTNGRLQAAPNGRFLRHETTGKPFFYLADSAWSLVKRLNRADIDLYFRDSVAQGFNAIQAAAVINWNNATSGAVNAYGDHPFTLVSGRYDPVRGLTTLGNYPSDPMAYDYWDHLDYVLDKAEEYGLYLTFEPTWGNYVSGTNSYARDMSSNIFTAANARTYGEFIGRRYGGRPNIIWMLGGDRSAVYPNGDFRPVWRAMAEGIGRGITGQALAWDQPHMAWKEFVMTYHATRRDEPGSSVWFHDDPWLDFNSIQAEYHSITKKVTADWGKLPSKPALVIETRFEDDLSTDQIVFTGAFKQRYQMYHSVLSGSLGYAYGHGRIWDFPKTVKTWQTALNDPGRLAVKTLWALLNGLSDAQLMNRVPDRTLLDGSIGTGTAEDLLVAMRGADGRFVLVYSTNGRDIRVVASKLAAGTADAFWFSPRTGRLYNSAGAIVTGPFAHVTTGVGAPIAVFNPPGVAGADNDWILKLVVR